MSFKVYHDPGHDARRPGTMFGGIEERLLAYDIAADILALQKIWPYISVRMSRSREQRSRFYRDRAADALKWGADLVMCHHINALVNDDGAPLKARGTVCFYLGGDQMGREAAESISRSVPDALFRKERRLFIAQPHDWTKHAWRVMHRYAELGLHPVLIEWGFSTSPADVFNLQRQALRPALAAAAMCGVAACIAIKHREEK